MNMNSKCAPMIAVSFWDVSLRKPFPHVQLNTLWLCSSLVLF